MSCPTNPRTMQCCKHKVVIRSGANVKAVEFCCWCGDVIEVPHLNEEKKHGPFLKEFVEQT